MVLALFADLRSPVAVQTSSTPRAFVPFEGVKVFSATMFEQRHALGDVVTSWLASQPALEPVDLVVTQSSDASFHCIAITVFYRARKQ